MLYCKYKHRDFRKKLKRVELAKFITFTAALPEETLDEYENAEEISRAILKTQR